MADATHRPPRFFKYRRRLTATVGEMVGPETVSAMRAMIARRRYRVVSGVGPRSAQAATPLSAVESMDLSGLLSAGSNVMYHVTGDWAANFQPGDTVLLRASQPLLPGSQAGVYFGPEPLWHYAGGERAQGKYFLEETTRPIVVFRVPSVGVRQVNSQGEEEFFVPGDVRFRVLARQEGTVTLGHNWFRHDRRVIVLTGDNPLDYSGELIRRAMEKHVAATAANQGRVDSGSAGALHLVSPYDEATALEQIRKSVNRLRGVPEDTPLTPEAAERYVAGTAKQISREGTYLSTLTSNPDVPFSMEAMERLLASGSLDPRLIENWLVDEDVFYRFTFGGTIYDARDVVNAARARRSAFGRLLSPLGSEIERLERLTNEGLRAGQNVASLRTTTARLGGLMRALAGQARLISEDPLVAAAYEHLEEASEVRSQLRSLLHDIYSEEADYKGQGPLSAMRRARELGLTLESRGGEAPHVASELASEELHRLSVAERGAAAPSAGASRTATERAQVLEAARRFAGGREATYPLSLLEQGGAPTLEAPAAARAKRVAVGSFIKIGDRPYKVVGTSYTRAHHSGRAEAQGMGRYRVEPIALDLSSADAAYALSIRPVDIKKELTEGLDPQAARAAFDTLATQVWGFARAMNEDPRAVMRLVAAVHMASQDLALAELERDVKSATATMPLDAREIYIKRFAHTPKEAVQRTTMQEALERVLGDRSVHIVDDAVLKSIEQDALMSQIYQKEPLVAQVIAKHFPQMMRPSMLDEDDMWDFAHVIAERLTEEASLLPLPSRPVTHEGLARMLVQRVMKHEDALWTKYWTKYFGDNVSPSVRDVSAFQRLVAEQSGKFIQDYDEFANLVKAHAASPKAPPVVQRLATLAEAGELRGAFLEALQQHGSTRGTVSLDLLGQLQETHNEQAEQAEAGVPDVRNTMPEYLPTSEDEVEIGRLLPGAGDVRASIANDPAVVRERLMAFMERYEELPDKSPEGIAKAILNFVHGWVGDIGNERDIAGAVLDALVADDYVAGADAEKILGAIEQLSKSRRRAPRRRTVLPPGVAVQSDRGEVAGFSLAVSTPEDLKRVAEIEQAVAGTPIGSALLEREFTVHGKPVDSFTAESIVIGGKRYYVGGEGAWLPAAAVEAATKLTEAEAYGQAMLPSNMEVGQEIPVFRELPVLSSAGRFPLELRGGRWVGVEGEPLVRDVLAWSKPGVFASKPVSIVDIETYGMARHTEEGLVIPRGFGLTEIAYTKPAPLGEDMELIVHQVSPTEAMRKHAARQLDLIEKGAIPEGEAWQTLQRVAGMADIDENVRTALGRLVQQRTVLRADELDALRYVLSRSDAFGLSEQAQKVLRDVISRGIAIDEDAQTALRHVMKYATSDWETAPITREMVEKGWQYLAEHGIPRAEAIRRMATDTASAQVIAGHNIVGFDIPVLERLSRRIKGGFTLGGRDVVDTYRLAFVFGSLVNQRATGQPLRGYELRDIAESLGIEVGQDVHMAEHDVMLTAKVLNEYIVNGRIAEAIEASGADLQPLRIGDTLIAMRPDRRRGQPAIRAKDYYTIAGWELRGDEATILLEDVATGEALSRTMPYPELTSFVHEHFAPDVVDEEIIQRVIADRARRNYYRSVVENPLGLASRVHGRAVLPARTMIDMAIARGAIERRDVATLKALRLPQEAWEDVLRGSRNWRLQLLAMSERAAQEKPLIEPMLARLEALYSEGAISEKEAVKAMRAFMADIEQLAPSRTRFRLHPVEREIVVAGRRFNVASRELIGRDIGAFQKYTYRRYLPPEYERTPRRKLPEAVVREARGKALWDLAEHMHRGGFLTDQEWEFIQQQDRGVQTPVKNVITEALLRHGREVATVRGELAEAEGDLLRPRPQEVLDDLLAGELGTRKIDALVRQHTAAFSSRVRVSRPVEKAAEQASAAAPAQLADIYSNVRDVLLDPNVSDDVKRMLGDLLGDAELQKAAMQAGASTRGGQAFNAERAFMAALEDQAAEPRQLRPATRTVADMLEEPPSMRFLRGLGSSLPSLLIPLAIGGGLYALGTFLSNSPLSVDKRPQADQAPAPDGTYERRATAQAPVIRQMTPRSYVTPNDSGYSGIRYRIRGKSTGYVRPEDLQAAIASSMNQMMPVPVNFNLNINDNSSDIDTQWIDSKIAEVLAR